MICIDASRYCLDVNYTCYARAVTSTPLKSHLGCQRQCLVELLLSVLSGQTSLAAEPEEWLISIAC